MPSFYTSIQMTIDELGNALKSLLPGPDKTGQQLGNSNGANVVLCTDEGFRVSLHEVLIRRFTNLLDAFDATGIEELRDPFGSLVIVLQEVEDKTLQALVQLLYTGECFIKSEEGKETLTEILALGVISELSGSPEDILPSSTSSHDYQPPQTDQTGEQDHTLLVCSGPDVSQKEVGKNNTELPDMQSEDSDTTYGTGKYDDAMEVLCNDFPSESQKDAENAEDGMESEGMNHFNEGDVEEIERQLKSNTSDKENLMENCEPPRQKSKNHCCEICNKVFTQKGDLKRHLRIHTGEKPFKCSHCDKQFTTKHEVRTHERTHTGEKPFKCSHCDKQFTQKCAVIVHERTHTGEKPFKCSHCDKQFITKYEVTTHERTHRGEKPFKCSHCDKQFTQKEHVIRHERTHTGEKPFKCSHCVKQFTTKYKVTTHERTHTGEKPFKCSYCDRKFAQKCNVKHHERTHKGEKPFKCSHCDKQFLKKTNAIRHERTHTGEISLSTLWNRIHAKKLT